MIVVITIISFQAERQKETAGMYITGLWTRRQVVLRREIFVS
jgi:hypothetical protein